MAVSLRVTGGESLGAYVEQASGLIVCAGALNKARSAQATAGESVHCNVTVNARVGILHAHAPRLLSAVREVSTFLTTVSQASTLTTSSSMPAQANDKAKAMVPVVQSFDPSPPQPPPPSAVTRPLALAYHKLELNAEFHRCHVCLSDLVHLKCFDFRIHPNARSTGRTLSQTHGVTTESTGPMTHTHVRAALMCVDYHPGGARTAMHRSSARLVTTDVVLGGMAQHERILGARDLHFTAYIDPQKHLQSLSLTYEHVAVQLNAPACIAIQFALAGLPPRERVASNTMPSPCPESNQQPPSSTKPHTNLHIEVSVNRFDACVDLIDDEAMTQPQQQQQPSKQHEQRQQQQQKPPQRLSARVSGLWLMEASGLRASFSRTRKKPKRGAQGARSDPSGLTHACTKISLQSLAGHEVWAHSALSTRARVHKRRTLERLLNSTAMQAFLSPQDQGRARVALTPRQAAPVNGTTCMRMQTPPLLH